MGNRQMPTAADFLDIRPAGAEQVLELGYLPQCAFGDGKPGRTRGCSRQPEWTIEGNYHCDDHKQEVEAQWEEMIAEWAARPAEAQDSDLELLEIVRDELESRSGELYPSAAVERVIKDLSLPDTEAGRSLASWYLWEMEIFSIHNRVRYFEAAA